MKRRWIYNIQVEAGAAQTGAAFRAFFDSLGWVAAPPGGAADFCFTRRNTRAELAVMGPLCAVGPTDFAAFANKSLLYDRFIHPYPPMRRFMPPQRTARWDAAKKEFKRPRLMQEPAESVWMVKNVLGSKGRDIHMTRRREIDTTLRRLSVEARRLPAKSARDPRKFGYVVSRYITAPLLLNGRKFHIRVSYIVTASGAAPRGYVRRDFITIVAAAPYAANSSNPMVHNVHVATGAVSSFDMAAFTREFGAARLAGLYDDMKVLFAHITRVYGEILVKEAEWVGAAAQKAGWMLFGADIMLMPDFTPQLLEINARPSLRSYEKSAAARLSFVRDIYEISVAPFYPPPPGYVMVRNFIEC